MLLLAYELFNKKNKTIHIKIGDLIPAKVFTSSFIDDSYQTKLLKKHVYLIGKNHKGIYVTEKNVIHPIDRKSIKRELNYAQLLGITKDKMRIYLTSKDESPQSIYEIARLRELTFRKVGEGTGKKFDLDRYDSYYSHLIVWDEKELDILGAYRIGQGDYIYNKYGKDGFYTSTLFDFSNNFSMNYLDNSIELGRSFIQKKYWNTNALYYLWQGIGAFLANNESVKFMFGGVRRAFTVGLVSGELLPRPEGKPYFSDPKVIWSALLWLVYLELIVARMFFGRSTRRFTIGVVVAFAFLLLTFRVTNLYSGLHHP